MAKKEKRQEKSAGVDERINESYIYGGKALDADDMSLLAEKGQIQLAEFLKEAIARSNKSQAEVARQANIAPPYLNQLLSGVKENPSPIVLRDLAEALDLDLPTVLIVARILPNPMVMTTEEMIAGQKKLDKFIPDLMMNRSFSAWFFYAVDDIDKDRKQFHAGLEKYLKSFADGVYSALHFSDDKEAERAREAPAALKFVVVDLILTINKLAGEEATKLLTQSFGVANTLARNWHADTEFAKWADKWIDRQFPEANQKRR